MEIITDTLTDTDAGADNPDSEILTYIRVTSKNLLAALVGPSPIPKNAVVDWAGTQVGRRGQLTFVCNALNSKSHASNFFELITQVELLLQIEAVRSILLRDRTLIQWSPEFKNWATEHYAAIMGKIALSSI